MGWAGGGGLESVECSSLGDLDGVGLKCCGLLKTFRGWLIWREWGRREGRIGHVHAGLDSQITGGVMAGMRWRGI